MPGLAWSKVWSEPERQECGDYVQWLPVTTGEGWRGFISLRVQSAPTNSHLKGQAGLKESEGEQVVNLSVSPDNRG